MKDTFTGTVYVGESKGIKVTLHKIIDVVDQDVAYYQVQDFDDILKQHDQLCRKYIIDGVEYIFPNLDEKGHFTFANYRGDGHSSVSKWIQHVLQYRNPTPESLTWKLKKMYLSMASFDAPVSGWQRFETIYLNE